MNETQQESKAQVVSETRAERDSRMANEMAKLNNEIASKLNRSEVEQTINVCDQSVVPSEEYTAMRKRYKEMMSEYRFHVAEAKRLSHDKKLLREHIAKLKALKDGVV
jgi:hypothetical protein